MKNMFESCGDVIFTSSGESRILGINPLHLSAFLAANPAYPTPAGYTVVGPGCSSLVPA